MRTRTRTKTGRGRAGQSMTEYIILVGVIAILLIFAIKRYRYQVDITIRGTDQALNDIGAQIEGEEGGPRYTPIGRTTGGYNVYEDGDGNRFITPDGSEPYDPATHGAIE